MVVGRLVYSKFDPVAPIAVLEGYKVGGPQSFLTGSAGKEGKTTTYNNINRI